MSSAFAMDNEYFCNNQVLIVRAVLYVFSVQLLGLIWKRWIDEQSRIEYLIHRIKDICDEYNYHRPRHFVMLCFVCCVELFHNFV